MINAAVDKKNGRWVPDNLDDYLLTAVGRFPTPTSVVKEKMEETWGSISYRNLIRRLRRLEERQLIANVPCDVEIGDTTCVTGWRLLPRAYR